MEDVTKTPEQELRELIVETKTLISRMKKTMNGMFVVAGVIFLPFFFSFIDVHSRVSTLEEQQKSFSEKYLPKDEVYRIFVQKVDALAVHMMEDDWKRTQLYEITHKDKYKTDLQTQQLIKAFFEEDHRGSN